LIHSLRLGYLRNVDDPYGSRLISFNPSFSTNPYINVASLADVNKWPELASPPSPPLSPDESLEEGPSQTRNVIGPLGARGLKYSSTIFGPSQSGALGMSVNGRRLVSKPTRPIVIAASQDDNNSNNAAPKPSPPPLKPIFIPKFKGAAEMDERRRLRIQVRRGVAAAAAAAAPETRVLTSPEKGATPELLSEDEEEEDSFSPEDDVDFDDVVDVGESVDLGDEFDP
jgi:hypothetical protein